MIRVIVALLLSTICLFFIVINRKLFGKNIFAPLSFFSIYFFITRIPRLLGGYNNLYGKNDEINELMVIQYLYVTVVFLLSVLLGVIVFRCSRSWKCTNRPYNRCASYLNALDPSIKYNKLYWVGLICFIIGAISRIYLIIRAGGLRYIWSHLYDRTVLLAGSGYIVYLTLCMTFGLAAVEVCVLYKKKSRSFFIILIILGSFLNLAFGARASMMKMITALIFVYWFCSPNKVNVTKLIRVKYIVPAIVIIIVLIVLPTFRTKEFEMSTNILSESVHKASENIGSIFDQIAMYDEDVYAFDYFSKGHFWYGRSYLGLLTAWVPRSLYPAKPPIDDGMYLRAIMKGYDVVPPMSVTELNDLSVASSIPFTTNGIMYANFGIIGSVIGGLLTGFILVGQYKKMINSGFRIDEVLLYQILCFRLSLSTKGIVELMMSVLIIKVFCGTIYKYCGVERHHTDDIDYQADVGRIDGSLGAFDGAK